MSTCARCNDLEHGFCIPFSPLFDFLTTIPALAAAYEPGDYVVYRGPSLSPLWSLSDMSLAFINNTSIIIDWETVLLFIQGLEWLE